MRMTRYRRHDEVDAPEDRQRRCARSGRERGPSVQMLLSPPKAMSSAMHDSIREAHQNKYIEVHTNGRNLQRYQQQFNWAHHASNSGRKRQVATPLPPEADLQRNSRISIDCLCLLGVLTDIKGRSAKPVHAPPRARDIVNVV